jgi:hypothetical protein
LRIEQPILTLGNWNYYADYQPGHRYALAADVSEGVGRHNSTVVVIDFDAMVQVGDRKINRPKVVAVYATNKIAPDLFAHEIKNGGLRYGNCLAAPERNNHGFTTITVLKDIYYHIHQGDDEKLGWLTTFSSKPKMMHELRSAVHEEQIEISDPALKQEIVSYPSDELNVPNVDEEDETSGHYDRLIALAIAWQLRSLATPTTTYSTNDIVEESTIKTFDRFAAFNEI